MQSDLKCRTDKAYFIATCSQMRGVVLTSSASQTPFVVLS
jgi:hypothetical protein